MDTITLTDKHPADLLKDGGQSMTLRVNGGKARFWINDVSFVFTAADWCVDVGYDAQGKIPPKAMPKDKQ